jgi:endonuclease/exonuclease/phosphatase (EEP) superfamily protein YafD
MSEKDQFTLEEAHLTFAKSFNGKVWGLLGNADRTPTDDQEMVMAAYSSAYHWRFVGTALHQQRAEWMLAHVHTVLGNSATALAHAQTCHELTEANKSQMKDFDLAYASEGLARAHALAKNQTEAKRYKDQARQLGDKIENAEDKKIFDGDFNSGDWFGV